MPKIISTIILSLLLMSQVVWADNNLVHKVRIRLNSKADMSHIYKSGIDLEGSRIKDGVFVECFANEYELNNIDDAGLQYEMLQYDMASFYEEQLAETQSSREYRHGSMGGYLTYDEIVNEMDSLFTQYPNLVSEKISIDTTLQGRHLWAFKISDNPEVDEDEPEVFFNSLTHAREPAAMMTILYFAWQLVENYDSDLR